MKFTREMNKLQSTYTWCLSADIELLVSFLDKYKDYPLVAVGSGGSLTAACYCALLHQQTGVIAKDLTPLAFANSRQILHQSVVILFSASGRNHDIQKAFAIAAQHALHVLVFTLRKGSPLYEQCQQHENATYLEMNLPSGKDGFLATNSLVAYMILLARSYAQINSRLQALLRLQSNSRFAVDPDISFIKLEKRIWNVNTWIVLFGGWGTPAALDLESKCIEAGLKNIQLADYRNFGHGRHHWIAKNANITGFVAFVSSDELAIATKTTALIPDTIPKVWIETKRSGHVATIDLLLKAFELVEQIGLDLGIDPGKPGVPQFGRKLYHLKYRYPVLQGAEMLEHSAMLQAIKRKIKVTKFSNVEKKAQDFWIDSYYGFVDKLKGACFQGIVFDLDGTLYELGDRPESLHVDIQTELLRLMGAGIMVGIATGRGKSARILLRNSIPSDYWSQIVVGYYNGGIISNLSDDLAPNTARAIDEHLEPVAIAFQKHSLLKQLAEITVRPTQITVIPNKESVLVGDMLGDVLRSTSQSVQLVSSAHSFDVIPITVSKLLVVEKLKVALINADKDGEVLCIGDRGQWPGNDFELLSEKYSLSVDTVSTMPDSCWNLNSQLGRVGAAATLEHLKMLLPNDKGFYYRI